MAQRSKSGNTGNDIDEQLKTIRKDVSELMNLVRQFGEEKVSETAGTAAEQADDLMKKSKKAFDDASHRAREQASSVEDYIVEKPLQCAFIALLVGLFIGSMSRR